MARCGHLMTTSWPLRGRLSRCRSAQRKLAADGHRRQPLFLAQQVSHREARAMSARAPLDVASLSHPGMVRTHNEDSVFVDGEAGLAVLADGMGGYSAGEVASGIAVNVISTGMLAELGSGRELSRVDIGSGLTHAALLLQQQIALANKGIYEAAQARPECAGMGTTLVATVFVQNRVSIGHIGDSRCYRLRVDRFD